jgi:acyl-CoA synthetase (AMP-forming)/AMP-acid ligase II/acyl carrier protein
MNCLYPLLEHQARRAPQALSICAPGRIPLTYGRLLAHLEDSVQVLHAIGVNRKDRVALVLPNGPEMAVAFLAVAAGATCAPLNPAYSAQEFDFYLSNLGAKALVVQSGIDSPARAVAQAQGIRIIELSPILEAEAGLFTLESETYGPMAQGGFAQPDDVALVLFTSGTTSRPKLVPLKQSNISASAHHIQAALQLTPRDRCLNVMPLFHVHGLIGALLSSLMAGGSVVCTPGLDPTQFFAWLGEFGPTWYTAVPAIHQSILVEAESHPEMIARCPLRLMRSSSSALSPRLMAGLEDLLGVPVIESYGMTEAAHQITSNPLPPRLRKPGSVGLAAGPEVAILDEKGNWLPAGTSGEIVIRGANVMERYENNPTANESAFTEDWFRTGDQGFLDVDGYLYITGRLKEIINRGGQKIAPREVDEVFMEHPAIAEVVTFAMPHATLGEDVAAAVVLKEKAPVTERELREFAFARLADSKVPTQVLIVDEIPKNPTGKAQRIGLATKLGSKLHAEYTAPQTPLEETLAGIWAEVLDLERVGIHDNFFALGGDSLAGARVLARVRATYQVELPYNIIFREPTVAELAAIIEETFIREIEGFTEEQAWRLAEME